MPTRFSPLNLQPKPVSQQKTIALHLIPQPPTPQVPISPHYTKYLTSTRALFLISAKFSNFLKEQRDPEAKQRKQISENGSQRERGVNGY